MITDTGTNGTNQGPRIPLFPMEGMSSEQRAVYQAIVSGPRGKVSGPLRAALHSPELADKWQQLGELLRFRTSLSPRLSELALLVTAKHWHSQFEWQTHAPIAARAGLPEALIESIRTGDDVVPAHPADAVVYRYCKLLLRDRDVDDITHAEALDLLGIAGIVELTAIVGYISMAALMLIAHRIPVPQEASTTPPLCR